MAEQDPFASTNAEPPFGEVGVASRNRSGPTWTGFRVAILILVAAAVGGAVTAAILSGVFGSDNRGKNNKILNELQALEPCTTCPVVQRFEASSQSRSATPSDTNLAVGPTVIIEVHNSNQTIRDRETLKLLDGIDGFEFGEFNQSGFTFVTDPVILYDNLDERFWFLQLAIDRFNAILNITEPLAIAGTFPASDSAAFGDNYTLTADVVAADPLNADTPLINGGAIAGNIALVSADGFQTGSSTKVGNACAAGAIGVIIFDDGDFVSSGIFGNECAPSIIVSNVPGLAMLNQLNMAQTVTVTMSNEVPSSTISQIMVAVSKTSSPTSWGASDWHKYVVGNTSSGGLYNGFVPDFPKMGFDSDAMYFTDNLFPVPFEFEIFAWNKRDLLDGLLPQPPFLLQETDAILRLLIPSGDLPQRANLPIPTNQLTLRSGIQAGFLVGPIGNATSVQNTVEVTVLSDILGTPQIQTYNIEVPTWDNVRVIDGTAPIALQPDITAPFGVLTPGLATLNRINFVVYLRGDRLLATHTVANQGRMEIRWYEFDVSQIFNANNPSVTLKQTGRLADPVNSYYYGHATIDKYGNIGIGYVSSGPNKFVHVGYTVQLCGDPEGTLRYPLQDVFVADVSYVAGTVSFEFFPILISRFDDYTSLVVDPEGENFYFTSEVPNQVANSAQAFVTSRWTASWFSFKAENICGTEPLTWEEVPPEPQVPMGAATSTWANASAEDIEAAIEALCNVTRCTDGDDERPRY